MQPTRQTRVRTAVLGLMLAVAVIVFGRTTFGTFCIVDGDSMSPTLNPGDVVQAKVLYVITRGDVVTLTDDSGLDAIKRVIGLPDEVVTIYGGEVYVNGRRLLEPYLERDTRTLRNNQKNEPAVVWHLAAGEYFVMGDNRYGSWDSRHYGPIRRSEIHGVVAVAENAPGPVMLETKLPELGERVQHYPERPIPNRDRSLLARRPSRSSL